MSGAAPSRLRAELRALLALSAPIALVQYGQLGLSIVDVAMVGRLSTLDLAGIALGNMLVWTLFMFGSGVLAVLDAVVSRSLGAGDQARVRVDVQTGLVLAVAVSIPLIAIGAFADPLFHLLRQPDDVVPLAVEYAVWSLPGLLPMLLFVAVRQSLQALTTIRPIIVAVLVANLLNAFGNWVLIFGHLGFPALGLQGAAIASVLVRTGMAAMLMWASWPILRGLLRPFDRGLLRLSRIAPMFRMGAPLGLQFVVEYGAFSGSLIFIGWLGERAVAAHKIALLLVSASYMLPLSLSMSAAVRVGHAMGRNDPTAVRIAARVAIGTGAAIMAACGVVFLLVPAGLAALFTDVDELVPAAARLVTIAALFQIFDGIQVVCVGVLRGLGDTRTPLFVNLFGFWGVGIPLGLFLAFRHGAGASGFWWGLVAGLGSVAIVLALRVRVLLKRAAGVDAPALL